MSTTEQRDELFQCCKCGEWTDDCTADNYRAGGEEDWCKECRAQPRNDS